jgi:MSHA biogenesis protein MshI
VSVTLFKPALRPGWMAVELRLEDIRVAHVVRPRPLRPRLLLRRSFERAGVDADDLGRLRRSLGLQHYRCTTSVEPSAYQIVQVNAPAVTPAEMNAALRWSVKDTLDFAAEDALIDSLAIPRDGAPIGRPPMVLAIAARRERVAARVRAFQRSGVPLRVIDVAETAQRNLAALFEQPDRALGFLAFNDRGGLLTFSRNGELHAVRHIDVRLAALSDQATAEARRPVFERITLELQRSLDNFDRLFSQIALQRVLVAPHDGCEALVAHLRENLAPPIELAALESVLDFAPETGFDATAEQAEWLHAIGLALRDEVIS